MLARGGDVATCIMRDFLKLHLRSAGYVHARTHAHVHAHVRAHTHVIFPDLFARGRCSFALFLFFFFLADGAFRHRKKILEHENRTLATYLISG